MDNNEKQYFENSVPLEESPEELLDLAGYQVTKAELFAHSREPSITFWVNRLKFNMACLRRFPGGHGGEGALRQGRDLALESLL